jgi:SNF2 family DNA or RNA helicase
MDDGQEHVFAWPTAVLERVVFHEGSFVELPVDGSSGIVVSSFDRDGVLIYQVNLANGASKVVPEASLRPGVVTDPIALLRSGQLDTARSTNLRIAATRLLFSHQYDELSSLSNSRVEIKPHQVGVVHRVATRYPHRALLADEVGLGKTIEAGLIIKELKARGFANRVLILAPSGIVSQWQFELKTKFNEVFAHYNRSSIGYLQANHPSENVWTVNDNVIVSSTYAAWTEERRREIALAGWDLVVVDEAHHVRRSYRSETSSTPTNLYHLVSALADPEIAHSRGLLLLTATPMQLHRFELYSLVELLDPTLFATFGDFVDHVDSVAELNSLVAELELAPDPATLRDDVSAWLDVPTSEIESRLRDPLGRRDLVDQLKSRHRLSEVLIRNRKAVVGGFMPRVAVVWPVEMSAAERAAYEAATAYVQHGYQRSQATRNNALGFLMAIFQKLNASSSYALRQSLLRRIEKLEALVRVGSLEPEIEEADLDERPVEEALGDWIAARPDDAVTAELSDLRRIVDLIDQIDLDAKARVLAENLEQIARDDPEAKVLVFTQFRDTQTYLARMSPISWDVSLFHGQLSPQEKDAAVGRFREGKGPQLLISTEAGGEGRNFQFAHILINYDLPWNPMKIEQRIGRLDRIGQRHPVTVINFAVTDTIEERVLTVLSERIQVFQETIGGLDPILGEVELDLRKVFLTGEAEARKALDRLDRELATRVRQARDAERRLADLIMDSKSFRQDEVQSLLDRRARMDPKGMQRYGLGALSELGAEVTRDPTVAGVFQIRLRGQFVTEFHQFVREGTVRRVTFDPAVALDHEDIEFLAFGHELIDAMVARTMSRNYPGRASNRLIKTNDIEPVRGWLFVYGLEFEGVTGSKQLFPVFVHESGELDTDIAQVLLDRSMLGKREDWDEARMPAIDASFEEAVVKAQGEALGALLDGQAQMDGANRERLEQERTKLERFYEYKVRAADEKLEAVQRTFERLSASSEPEAQRILPVWAKNLENARRVVETTGSDRVERLAQLERRADVSASHELISASWVEVKPDANHIPGPD